MWISLVCRGERDSHVQVGSPMCTCGLVSPVHGEPIGTVIRGREQHRGPWLTRQFGELFKASAADGHSIKQELAAYMKFRYDDKCADMSYALSVDGITTQPNAVAVVSWW